MDYDDICIDKVLIAEVRTISYENVASKRNRCQVLQLSFFLRKLAHRLDLRALVTKSFSNLYCNV